MICQTLPNNQQFNIEVLNAKLGYQGAEVQNKRLMDDVEIPKA